MAGGRKGQRDLQIHATGSRGTKDGPGLGPTYGHAVAQRPGGGEHDQAKGHEERKAIGGRQGEAGKGHEGTHSRQRRGGGCVRG
eukprot:5237354-Heterocapsa_arctica.AAC.1